LKKENWADGTTEWVHPDAPAPQVPATEVPASQAPAAEGPSP
jgi:hypothetical protein